MVIDGRDRELRTFTASVTAVKNFPNQLILRYGLKTGKLKKIIQASNGCLETKMPILLMGEYSARSSAGFVEIKKESCSHHDIVVVGGLGQPFGKGCLKILTIPIAGTLIKGPAEIKKLAGMENSNPASAEAALAGVELLAELDPRSVFLTEGQSDYTYVVRIKSLAEEEEEGEISIPPEHQAMFSPENIVKNIVRKQILRRYVEGYTPSEQQLKDVVDSIIDNIQNNPNPEYWDEVRGLSLLGMSSDEIVNILRELF